MHDGVVWVLNEVSVGCSVKLFLYCQGLLEKLWVEGGGGRKKRGREEKREEGRRKIRERERRGDERGRG